MTIGIYKITNLINNKVYIGQSVDIKRRWHAHRNPRFDNKNPLYSDIRSFNIVNFSFEIIEECDFSLLDEKEIYWIKYYNSIFPNGYNLTSGGSGAGHIVKISNEDLEIIYDLLLNSNITQREIANLFDIGEDTVSEINNGKTRINEKYEYPIRKNYKKNYCIDCGIEILPKSTRCDKCNKFLLRKVERPNREELKNLIRNNSFVELGKQFNISDNGIRKWCKTENLPSKKNEIKSYSDEEWELI